MCIVPGVPLWRRVRFIAGGSLGSGMGHNGVFCEAIGIRKYIIEF